MQIKLIALSVCLIALSGCVGVKYETAKGDKFIYNRFGN